MTMHFDIWDPVYEHILTDFGFERAVDEQARDLLQRTMDTTRTLDPSTLDFSNQTVAIAGGADSLLDDQPQIERADAVIAASDAATMLREHDLQVDCIVTDLDEEQGILSELTHEGVPVTVHAHGDNMPAIRSQVPALDHSAVIPTTQAEPSAQIYNFGGFTDGDRAAFLADEAEASRLIFPGWDLDDFSVGPQKQRKLQWAERLLYWLERRRGDSFDLLDGRRDRIDRSALPLE